MHAQVLATNIADARKRTLELIGDLTDQQLRVVQIPIVNPLDWEVGHIAHFQELFILRDLDGEPSQCANADALFDSILIDHHVRWGLKLPSRADLMAYLNEVSERVRLRALRTDPQGEDLYRNWLAVFHEDMHTEAITYTRQTMGYSPPRLTVPHSTHFEMAALATGDAHVPGGTVRFGGLATEPFVFDNEQWAQPTRVTPFSIARTAVTQAEFAAFVDDGGYHDPSHWCDEGWKRRQQVTQQPGIDSVLDHPLYWRRSGQGWERRVFDRWVPLASDLPVLHVNWYEASAYCRWAGRRLPTELEWEVAASAKPAPDGETLIDSKRRYPWGNGSPTPSRANLDWRALKCLPVQALPAGDSAFGCRQMIGNTWEWTADTFGPLPGFEPGPYKEYSAPLFGSTKVLRGGCWATRSRLIRTGYRNYYEPHRRDVWAGFRTAAL
jgi:iron(II)-dependent oxidoreductase